MIALMTIGSFVIYGALIAGLSGLFCKPADMPRYMATSKTNNSVCLDRKAYV